MAKVVNQKRIIKTIKYDENQYLVLHEVTAKMPSRCKYPYRICILSLCRTNEYGDYVRSKDLWKSEKYPANGRTRRSLRMQILEEGDRKLEEHTGPISELE